MVHIVSRCLGKHFCSTVILNEQVCNLEAILTSYTFLPIKIPDSNEIEIALSYVRIWLIMPPTYVIKTSSFRCVLHRTELVRRKFSYVKYLSRSLPPKNKLLSPPTLLLIDNWFLFKLVLFQISVFCGINNLNN